MISEVRHCPESTENVQNVVFCISGKVLTEQIFLLIDSGGVIRNFDASEPSLHSLSDRSLHVHRWVVQALEVEAQRLHHGFRLDLRQCLVVNLDSHWHKGDRVDSDELEAAVEAVAVVSEGRANPLSESIAESPVLRSPVCSCVEEAADVTSGINLSQNGLHRHCQLVVILVLQNRAKLVEAHHCSSE